MSDIKKSKWGQFLETVTQGDQGLQRQLQQLAGAIYSQPESARHLVLYGPGANGKTAFLKALGLVLPRRALAAVRVTNVPPKGKTTVVRMLKQIPPAKRRPVAVILRELRGESAGILAWAQAGSNQSSN